MTAWGSSNIEGKLSIRWDKCSFDFMEVAALERNAVLIHMEMEEGLCESYTNSTKL